MKKCFHSISFLALALVFAASLISCAKKAPQATINLNFSDSNLGGLSYSYQVEHVIVQEGLKNYQWSCEYGDNCNDISFETQSSDNKALQVFVIAKQLDSATGFHTMKFFYKGEYKNISPGTNDFSFNLVEIESEANMAIFSGRYIPSSGHILAGKYLTGEITASAKLQANMPPLSFLKHEIFAGFTNLYLFNNIPLRYFFKGHDSSGNFVTGLLFNDLYSGVGLTANAAALIPSAGQNNTASYELSGATYWEENDGTWERRYFQKRIVGFFGQNPDGRTLCTETVPSGDFDGSNGSEELCANSGCSSYHTWSAITSGGDAHTNVCTSGSTSELSLELMDLPDEGEFFDAYGPFSGQSIDVDDVDFDDTSMELKWHWSPNLYLPYGVEIFTTQSDFDEDDYKIPLGEGVDCKKIKDSSIFNSKGVFLPTDTETSYALTGTDLSPNTKIAVCVKKSANTYYATGHIDDDQGGDQGSSGLLEFQLHENASGAILSGYEFGGSQWDSGWATFAMPATNTASNSKIWINIKNTGPNSVTVDSHHFHYGASAFSLDWASADNPPATTTKCSDPSTPGLSLASGAHCVVQAIFNGTGYSPGSSHHEGLSIDHHDSVTSDSYQSGFDIIGLVYVNIDLANTPVNPIIDFYAPSGKNDIKVVRLDNTGGGGSFAITNLPASGSTVDQLDFVHGCSDPIAMGDSCLVHMVFDHSGGGVSDDTDNDSGNPIDLGSHDFFAKLYTAKPTLDQDPAVIFDLGQISNNTQIYASFTNNSAYSPGMAVGSAPNDLEVSTDHSNGTPNSITDPAVLGYCDGGFLSPSGGQCDLHINIIFDSGFGSSQEWFKMVYEIGNTFRAIDYNIDLEHGT